jgi:hypothetical protein
MAGVVKSRQGDDDIYEAITAVNGGDLVVPSTVGVANPTVQGIAQAGAAAVNVLGVAARRAEPVSSQNLTSTDADGYPVAYPNPVSELTAVYKHCVTTVVYTAAAVAFGAKLVAAANGQVAAAGAAPDSRTVIGECRVLGGMTGAGGAGLAYIY